MYVDCAEFREAHSELASLARRTAGAVGRGVLVVQPLGANGNWPTQYIPLSMFESVSFPDEVVSDACVYDPHREALLFAKDAAGHRLIVLEIEPASAGNEC